MADEPKDDPQTITADPAEDTIIAEQEPEAQLPATRDDASPANRREGYEVFAAQLEERATEIASQLPSNLSIDRFKNASIAAVRANPGILVATPRSLMAALTKAAQDGLLPDGREGVITVFSTKVGQARMNLAQWNPMLFGIRKRARELDGIIIEAQVVYTGDEFDYLLGDEPRIYHKPRRRAEGRFIPATEAEAAYAIFRHPTQGILHREVMWANEIEVTRNKSRAKDSLMWTTFWPEGWRKTVVRRGSKTVPVSADFTRLVQREDENFDFGADNRARLPASGNIADRLATGTKPEITYAAPAAASGPAKAEEAAPLPAQPGPQPAGLVSPPAAAPASLGGEEAQIYADLYAALVNALTPAKLALVEEEFAPALDLGTDNLKREAMTLIEAARKRVAP